MWWNSMSTLQQVMFVIACVATAVLIIQIIFMLVGGNTDTDVSGGGISDGGLSDGDVSGGGISGGDTDFDSDIFGADLPSSGGMLDGGGISDGDTDTATSGGGSTPFGLRLLSLRSIIAFVAVGGWMCYTLCYSLEWYVAVIIAAICGMAAACGMAGAMIGMEKLQSSGNINPQNAVGKIGTVYLTVPPSRQGRGKVNILVQERYAEYEAITDSGDAIPTTAEIKVIGYAGANVLIVERYKKPSITVTTE